MTHISFVNGLKSILPKSSWPWMFAALKHDPVIWDCLSGIIGDRILDQKSTNPSDYSPASISLTALELPTTADQLRSAPMEPAIDGEVDEWEVILADIPIAQAGMLALEMRERYHSTGSWSDVFCDVSKITPTGLACLHGMIPEPVEMLRSLLASNHAGGKNESNIELALHALLSNPIQPREIFSNLGSLIDGISPSQQLDILKMLSRYRPELAAKLSGRIRDAGPVADHNRQSKIELLTDSLVDQIRKAALANIESDSDGAISSLEGSISTAKLLEARLAANVAEIASRKADPQKALAAWEMANELNPGSVDFKAGYAINLVDENRIADAQAHLGESHANHPGHLLATAMLYLKRGEYSDARQAALAALDSVDLYALTDDTIPANLSSRLAQILLELNQPQQAIQAAEFALSHNPNNPELFALLSCASSAATLAEAALLAAHLAVTASPDSHKLNLHLAEALEIVGDWSAALMQRSLIIEEQDAQSDSELLDLARCAIFAEQPESAVEVCQHLLQQDENNAEAMIVLGKAKAVLGDSQVALEYLHQGTQFLPDSPISWMELARFYRDEGQNQKALETIQAASHATPDSPEIHLALGETHLELGELTQALTSLQIALELISSLPQQLASPRQAYNHGVLHFQTSLCLGETLHKLGHLEDAIPVLANAYQQAPTFPELARSYTEALLDSGEIQSAITPLETILTDEPEDIDPYLKYAQSLLALHDNSEVEIEVGRAIPELERALEMYPGHPEGTVLLAEVLAANNELIQAMDAYNKALETELAKEPEWHVRLSLGFGRVALKLGQIETAVASLQEAYQSDPINPGVVRSLAEAYNAADLTEDAYATAKTVLDLVSNDVDTLIWFVDQVESLLAKPGFHTKEAQAEVLNALDKATELEPRRTDLWVRSGQAHQRSGDNLAAITAYKTIAEIYDPSSPSPAADLYQAAQGLMELEDPGSAVNCLERALQPDYTPVSPSDPSLLDILIALSRANFQNGDAKSALDALNQAIDIAPDESSLYIDKADLLLEVDNEGHLENTDLSEALSCLDTALELNPQDPKSHYRAARIRRTAGDIPTALEHAGQLISLSSESTEDMLAARTLAAELALAMIQPDLARNYLDYSESKGEAKDHHKHLDFHCLQAEMALDAGEDHLAVNQLVKILETAPEDPRVLAIQARLSIKRGDYHAAKTTFNTAYQAIGDPSNASTASLRILAETALESRQWQISIELHRYIRERSPKEPGSHLALARAIVLRAEYERLCQTMDAVQRSPGESSMDEDAHREFEVAILEAKDQVDIWEDTLYQSGNANQDLNISRAAINRWQARGEAIFAPSQKSAQAIADLPHKTPGDVAALVACLHQTGELKAAGIAAREYPQNALVLIQLALALSEDKPRQALSAIQAASESTRRPKSLYTAGMAGVNIEIEPFILAFQARHYHLHGQSFEDQANALKCIQTALTIWPDEPRWHALAAQIHLSGISGDKITSFSDAIPHLERAIELDPNYADAYLTLGNIYLKEGSTQKAIDTIKAAADLVPDQATPWMLLAQAHLVAGDLDQAGSYVERAVTLSPNEVGPLLLRGEIDLKAGNPNGAQSRAQAALRINPDDMAAMSLLAHSLSELGRPDEALSLLEIALQNTPDSLPLSLEKVRIIRHTEGKSTALQAINELNTRYPDEPVILASQAEALDEAGEYENAIQAAQSALRLDSDQGRLSLSEQAKLHYLLGCSFRRAGQLDQAVHHLSEAKGLSPEVADIYLELGKTHEERREYDQAMNTYQQAINAIPNDYRAYYQIGVTLKECKDYQGAEKMLRKAAELAPNEPSIHRMLAAVVALNLVHNYRDEVPQNLGISA